MVTPRTAARDPLPAEWIGGSPTASATSQGHRTIRVLLADDSEVVRSGLAHLLGMQPDIEVVGQAADGLEAVQLAAQQRPDVVVMDVSMPYLSGVQVTRRLRQTLPEIRVIGLSMHVEEDVGLAMAAAGAVAYVAKASSPRTLLAAIRRWANRSIGVATGTPAT